MTALKRLRSVLIVGGDQPDVMANIPDCRPDGVMMDLACGIAIANKADARAAVLAAATLLTTEHPDVAVFTRVNALHSQWFEQDLAGLHPHIDAVAVQRIVTVEDVALAREALANADQGHLGIVVALDSVAAVERAPQLLSVNGVVGGYFDADAYVRDIGGIRTAGNTEVLYARSRVAAAASVAGVVSLDQLAATSDEAVYRSDAMQGRAIGFSGKLCVQPGQVRLANEVFVPAPGQVQQARRLLAAYDAAEQGGETAIDFEGEVVDGFAVKRAQRLLDAAGEDWL